MQYVPEGGGSHHWHVVDQHTQPHFVTVDDLDNKDWMADTRDAVFHGLARALRTAAALRYDAGLMFVVAPVPTLDGDLLRRVDARYTVAVYPFLTGQSLPFGPYADDGLRDQALALLIAMHRATPAVRADAPKHALRFAGRNDLDAFLAEPVRPWTAGPFSEPTRQVLASRTADLAHLVAGYDRLVASTARARERMVVTHGEPHPANLMSVDGGLFLVDWDTAALAPPERDLSLLAATPGADLDRYQQATGHVIDADVLTLYRLRWYLDDVASAVRLFRNAHDDTADTRRWSAGLRPLMERLPAWLDALG